MGKYCVYRSCKNHSNSQSSDIIDKKIFFIPVPKSLKDLETCKRWVEAINREDITTENIKKHHYICSKHFEGGNGPTPDSPYPIKDVLMDVGVPKAKRKKPKVLDNFCTQDHSYSYSKSRSVKCFEKSLSSNSDNTNDYSCILNTEANCSTNIQCEIEEIQAAPYHLESDLLLNSQCPDEKAQKSDILREQLFSEGNLEEIRILKDKNQDEGSKEDQEDATVIIGTSVSFKDIAASPIILKEQSPSVLNYVREQSNPKSPVVSGNINKLENLLQQYLIHQVKNIRNTTWCVDMLRNINFDDSSSVLLFRKRVKKKLFIELEVSSNMSIKVFPCDTLLSSDHNIIASKEINIQEAINSLQDLLMIMKKIDEWKICGGVNAEEYPTLKNNPLHSSYYCQATDAFRSKKCQLLFKSKISSRCQPCRLIKIYLQRQMKKIKN